MAEHHEQAAGHAATHHAHAAHGHISVRTYYTVFAALMGLMILTVAAWYVEKNLIEMPTWLAVAIAMSIAIAKTALIVIYFMHVKVADGVTKVYASMSFFFLIVLFAITMADYVARGWPAGSGPLP